MYIYIYHYISMILGVSSECIVVPLNDPLHLTPVQLPVEGLGIKSCVQGYHPAYPVVGASWGLSQKAETHFIPQFETNPSGKIIALDLSESHLSPFFCVELNMLNCPFV